MRRPRCHETKGVWKSVQNRKAFRETLLVKQSASASCIQWVTRLKKQKKQQRAFGLKKHSIKARDAAKSLHFRQWGNPRTNQLIVKQIFLSSSETLWINHSTNTAPQKFGPPTLKMKDFSLTVKAIHSKAGSEWQSRGQGCGTEALLSLCSVCCST